MDKWKQLLLLSNGDLYKCTAGFIFKCFVLHYKSNTFSLSIIEKIKEKFLKDFPHSYNPETTTVSTLMYFSSNDLECAISCAL